MSIKAISTEMTNEEIIELFCIEMSVQYPSPTESTVPTYSR